MEIEYYDELNEHGLKTGKVLSRDEIHKNMLWHGAIKVVLINNNNEILIQQRSFNKKYLAGLWDFTVTGHARTGENAYQTCIREVKEETGISLNESDLKFQFSFHETFENLRSYERLFFNCFIAKSNFDFSDVKKQDEEVDDVRLISIDELSRLLKTEKFTNQIEQEQLLQIVLKEIK